MSVFYLLRKYLVTNSKFFSLHYLCQFFFLFSFFFRLFKLDLLHYLTSCAEKDSLSSRGYLILETCPLANFPVTSEFPWTCYRGGQAGHLSLVSWINRLPAWLSSVLCIEFPRVSSEFYENPQENPWSKETRLKTCPKFHFTIDISVTLLIKDDCRFTSNCCTKPDSR